VGLELAEVVGHLADLHRFPVEPLGGEGPSEALIRGNRLVGDRLFDVCEEPKGEPLPVSVVPQLLLYGTRCIETPGSGTGETLTRVKNPAGREFPVSDPELAADMTQTIGRKVTIKRRAASGDAALLHLLSRGTLRLAERTYGGPLEQQRLRANFLVEIAEGKAFAEDAWIGKKIRIGDALLEIIGPSSSCIVTAYRPEFQSGDLGMLSGLLQVHGGHLGVSARAVSGSRVRIADSVILVD
jgi:uncharacterized protein